MVVAALNVFMNGILVGEYWQRRNGEHQFTYDDSWYDRQEEAIPLSLSLPLTQQKHSGDVVYNYFDNLLPDNNEIRNRIQTQFSTTTNKPYDLLSAIGGDCVGAIQLLNRDEIPDINKIEGIPLSTDEIADNLRKYRTQPLGMTPDIDFRISIAGAQEKTALLKHEGKWMHPVGTTPTTHIFKLPIGEITHAGIDLSNSVENEWLCLNLLSEFNIPVPKTEMIQFDEMKVLVVERFDRIFSDDNSWVIRLPQEDMCQAHGIAPALKYESDGGPGIELIMGSLNASQTPLDDRYQYMKTVFLFWLLGAIDGHAKNFSIFLKAGGRFNLTPVYDVMSAYPIAEKHELEFHDLKMAMAVRSKNKHYHWKNIFPRHWIAQAQKIDFPQQEMEKIFEETLNQVDTAIHNTSRKIPGEFDDQLATAIFDNLKKAAAKFS